MGNRQRREVRDETFEPFPKKRSRPESPARSGFRQVRQQHLVSEAFLGLWDELSDPIFEAMEVTWVSVSEDGKVLRVYWQAVDVSAAEAALAKAAPFLRVRLAEVMGGKHVPMICFERDPRIV